jgi:4-amino-4-deoxy-L-arabinose transferase-like glycosyltransferase
VVGAFTSRAVLARLAVPPAPEALALTVLLAGALVLRCWGIYAGLPGRGLLSPDEDTVVPKALWMLDHGTANPNWFLYPSLYLSVLAGALWLVGGFVGAPAGFAFSSPEAYIYDPSPYLLTGRLLSVAAGVGLVMATWALGRRAFGPAVGLIAAAAVAVSPMAVAYSHVAVTDMAMAAALTAGLWLLVGAVQERSRRRLLAAALVLGLATSLKYNAGFAVLPLAGSAVGLAREAGARWVSSARAALAPVGALLAGFLAGTPFAVLDPVTFAQDFWRQNRIVADGWLGFERSGPGWLFNLRPVLWGAIGGAMVLLAVAGLATAAVRRGRADLVLAPYALAYFVYVSSWGAHFDRYLLPIVPVVLVLGARAGVEAVGALRRRSRPALAAVLALGLAAALVEPAAESAALVRGYAQHDLRLDAVRIIAKHVPLGAAIAVDPLGPPLIDQEQGVRLVDAGHPVAYYALLRLQTPEPGVRADPNRNVAVLRRAGIRWVVTSNNIRARVMQASARYPREARFYRQLARHARLTARIPASLGPGVALWRLGPRLEAPQPGAGWT